MAALNGLRASPKPAASIRRSNLHAPPPRGRCPALVELAPPSIPLASGRHVTARPPSRPRPTVGPLAVVPRVPVLASAAETTSRRSPPAKPLTPAAQRSQPGPRALVRRGPLVHLSGPSRGVARCQIWGLPVQLVLEEAEVGLGRRPREVGYDSTYCTSHVPAARLPAARHRPLAHVPPVVPPVVPPLVGTSVSTSARYLPPLSPARATPRPCRPCPS